MKFLGVSRVNMSKYCVLTPKKALYPAWIRVSWKDFAYKPRKKESGNFGYMGRSNPWGDLDQMWHVGRYGGRNHVCNIWWLSVNGCKFGDRGNFALSHWLRIDRTQNFVNVVGPWPLHVCQLWSGAAVVCRTYFGKSRNKWKQYSWHRDTLFNSLSTTIKVFKLAWNQLYGFHNNSSDLTHLNSGFLGRFQTTYYRQGNKRVAKRLWGCVNVERQHSYTSYNFW